MKKLWRLFLFWLVLSGITALSVNFVSFTGARQGPAQAVWGAANVASTTSPDQGKQAIDAKAGATKAARTKRKDLPADAAVAATVARAPRVAAEYVTAIRTGRLYGDVVAATVACVALDSADSKRVGRGINGIWRSNPSIFKTTLTDSEAIVALYRRALTDQYLDGQAKADPDGFIGQNLNEIKAEMAKFRAMIQRTKDRAAKAGKYYKNDPLDPSLEFNWRVENCAEIWAVWNAIRQGAKLKNIVIRTVSIKNGKVKALCRNCTVTFADLIKAMD
jgi:hypothetical protein